MQREVEIVQQAITMRFKQQRHAFAFGGANPVAHNGNRIFRLDGHDAADDIHHAGIHVIGKVEQRLHVVRCIRKRINHTPQPVRFEQRFLLQVLRYFRHRRVEAHPVKARFRDHCE